MLTFLYISIELLLIASPSWHRIGNGWNVIVASGIVFPPIYIWLHGSIKYSYSINVCFVVQFECSQMTLFILSGFLCLVSSNQLILSWFLLL